MTATMTAPTTASRLPEAATRTPSIGRLTAVELRKMTDTRAGFWLLVVTGLSAVAFVVLQLIFAEPQDQRFQGLFVSTLLPTGILLPVLGILSVTSEWSQRTALNTFALVPRRSRVALAKLFASIVLAVLSVVAGLATAALGNLAGIAFADIDGSWDLTGTAIPYALLFNVINILMGLAFGMLLMNSAVAIVLYFLLPTIWGALGELIRALRTPAEWLDLGRTMTPLAEDAMTADAWPKLAVSVGVWVLLPLVAGLVRLLRREVS
jgi:ABC-2 type transport system permease protein